MCPPQQQWGAHGHLHVALRLHYTELYKDDPNLIGIRTTAQPLVDRINARGAADGAPTPTDTCGPHHPQPLGATAQDPPRKRRAEVAVCPPLLLRRRHRRRHRRALWRS